MTGRVVIAGASGFIGRSLAAAFIVDGATVSFIGRHGADARWRDTAGIAAVLEGADLLVNLAGKSVNCRYTEANRAEILRSRVDTTRELGEAIRSCERPPALWINSSTATIYRHAEDRPMTEAGGEIGTGFSVDVATAWEREFFAPDLAGTRRVALRMAIVLGNGGALLPMLRLARFGLGGAQLDGHWFSTTARRAAGTFHEFRARGGSQKFSWVHIADVLGIIQFLRERTDITGIVNAAAPNPSDSRTIMRTLRMVLRMPIGLPAPRWMLELGSVAIKTETELVLKSRWVIPERLEQLGYSFEYPELEPAIRDIVSTGLPSLLGKS
jgi:NAD dependent epimerase/dehydratase family enzyme